MTPQSMRLRDELYRHGIRRFALAGAPVLAMLALVGLAAVHVLPVWFLLAFVPYLAGIVALALWCPAHCPQCAVGLEFRQVWRLRRGNAALRTNYCAHCSIDFDAPAGGAG